MLQVDNLLHLHGKKKLSAPRGSNGDPAQGSGGPKRRDRTIVKKAAPLKISVPPGTVVKDNKGRRLAELVNVGDVYCAAAGGVGGHGVIAPSKEGMAKDRLKQKNQSEVLCDPSNQTHCAYKRSGLLYPESKSSCTMRKQLNAVKWLLTIHLVHQGTYNLARGSLVHKDTCVVYLHL